MWSSYRAKCGCLRRKAAIRRYRFLRTRYFIGCTEPYWPQMSASPGYMLPSEQHFGFSERRQSGKMQNRAASRAGLEIGHARFCTYLCADISCGCAVLTKFLIHLNFRGGFHRRVLARTACSREQKCMLCRSKSQENASRFSSCSTILHSTHTKTCKKEGLRMPTRSQNE